MKRIVSSANTLKILLNLLSEQFFRGLGYIIGSQPDSPIFGLIFCALFFGFATNLFLGESWMLKAAHTTLGGPDPSSSLVSEDRNVPALPSIDTANAAFIGNNDINSAASSESTSSVYFVFDDTIKSSTNPSGIVAIVSGQSSSSGVVTVTHHVVPTYMDGTVATGYFHAPTTGLNFGILHHFNAVDIANDCGTPIWASADGYVTRADDGFARGRRQNDGYGNLIVISQYPDGTGIQTWYAHLDSIIVDGGYVNQGEQIGTMGNTGHTIGETGCHLHFEVHGAKNPFARR